MACLRFVAAAILLCGCYPYQAASSGAVGCNAHDIEIRDKELSPGLAGPTRTWTAICHDRQLLCSSVANGNAECEPVTIAEARVHRTRAERSIDPTSHRPIAHGHVRIDVRQSLDLVAEPSPSSNTSVTMRVLKRRGIACEAVQWTLNGSQLPTVPVQVRDEGPTYQLQTRMGPVLIRELLRPHPTLSIEGCGQTLMMDEAAMQTLAEFARIVDDSPSPAASSGGESTPVVTTE